MGRTVSNAPGYAPDDEFDPRIDDFAAKDRGYLHFDLPLSDEERDGFRVSGSVICSNSFWPLIGYTSVERRMRKDDSGALQFKVKERPIKFGSHRDAAIYEYYARVLSSDYEKLLVDTGISRCILAYRGGIGNNIDHAKSLFDEIRSRGNCIAIALDISGFFDNIRHDVLYKSLLTVKNSERLGAVDFTLFRRLTRFEWVESEDLKSRLGSKYGRNGRICNSHQFRKLVRGRKPSVILQNKNLFGIPQGTPLSGLYANISLNEFDRKIYKLVDSVGGSYRRYSDDIAIILPINHDYIEFIDHIERELSSIGLEVSSKKTEIRKFSKSGDGLKSDKPFQYLGFTFDGNKTLIRQSSLNRYYTKMNRGIRAKIRAAKNQNIPAHEVFMRELFRKYTHFGRGRNFPRYAYRAATILQAPEIRNQLRGHMAVFKQMVSSAVRNIY